MKYVMSDIHGAYDKFIQMLEVINFSDNDELYILGDVIDRGKDSIKALLYIMGKQNIYMSLANHEEMVLDYFKRNKLPKNMSQVYEQSNYEIWFRNGGIETIRELIKTYPNEIDNLLNYLKSLPLAFIIETANNKFYMAHADLEHLNGKILINQDRDYMLWNPKSKHQECILEDGTYLVTGHMHQIDSKILKHDSWICVASETNCGSGKLSCLRLDDFEEFYV